MDSIRALLPQVNFRNDNLLMSLVAGLLFGLVYTFVQPFVIILVGQLLIQTMGLLMCRLRHREGALSFSVMRPQAS